MSSRCSLLDFWIQIFLRNLFDANHQWWVGFQEKKCLSLINMSNCKVTSVAIRNRRVTIIFVFVFYTVIAVNFCFFILLFCCTSSFMALIWLHITFARVVASMRTHSSMLFTKSVPISAPQFTSSTSLVTLSKWFFILAQFSWKR